jgi:hypothetical protein
VRILLDAGADIAGTSSHGNTALHAACDEGCLEIVELLLERGASLDAKNKEGLRPYALANKAPIRKFLRAKGDPGIGPRGGKILEPKVTANAKNMEVSRGAIGIDREGGVWFGGYSGLFRYDGKAMTRYSFEESIAIGNIDPGPPGVVYIATNWGLIEFKNDTFTLFRSEDSELFGNHITDMATAPTDARTCCRTRAKPTTNTSACSTARASPCSNPASTFRPSSRSDAWCSTTTASS